MEQRGVGAQKHHFASQPASSRHTELQKVVLESKIWIGSRNHICSILKQSQIRRHLKSITLLPLAQRREGRPSKIGVFANLQIFNPLFELESFNCKAHKPMQGHLYLVISNQVQKCEFFPKNQDGTELYLHKLKDIWKHETGCCFLTFDT